MTLFQRIAGQRSGSVQILRPGASLHEFCPAAVASCSSSSLQVWAHLDMRSNVRLCSSRHKTSQGLVPQSQRAWRTNRPRKPCSDTRFIKTFLKPGQTHRASFPQDEHPYNQEHVTRTRKTPVFPAIDQVLDLNSHQNLYLI